MTDLRPWWSPSPGPVWRCCSCPLALPSAACCSAACSPFFSHHWPHSRHPVAAGRVMALLIFTGQAGAGADPAAAAYRTFESARTPFVLTPLLTAPHRKLLAKRFAPDGPAQSRSPLASALPRRAAGPAADRVLPGDLPAGLLVEQVDWIAGAARRLGIRDHLGKRRGGARVPEPASSTAMRQGMLDPWPHPSGSSRLK